MYHSSLVPVLGTNIVVSTLFPDTDECLCLFYIISVKPTISQSLQSLEPFRIFTNSSPLIYMNCLEQETENLHRQYTAGDLGIFDAHLISSLNNFSARLLSHLGHHEHALAVGGGSGGSGSVSTSCSRRLQCSSARLDKFRSS